MAKELARLTITPGENGGHVVEHEFKRPAVDKHPLAYQEPEKHIFGPGDDVQLTAHISKALGLSDAPEEEAEARAPKAAQMAARVRSRVNGR
ncbi:MAG: hypothetical protein KGL39_50755 [Patescibacteria group bacterium]|nr:hypothetical protein [Patescibacteria group bacterium]